MAKIELSRKEIEKMIKEQLGCRSVTWDEDGNAMVELDLEALKKKEKEVEVIKEHHYHHDSWPYPIYIARPVRPYPYPYWSLRNVTSSGISSTPRLTFNAGSK
jgi:hypothetical protein